LSIFLLHRCTPHPVAPLHATYCTMQAASCTLQAASCTLQAARCTLHVALGRQEEVYRRCLEHPMFEYLANSKDPCDCGSGVQPTTEPQHRADADANAKARTATETRPGRAHSTRGPHPGHSPCSSKRAHASPLPPRSRTLCIPTLCARPPPPQLGVKPKRVLLRALRG
jgi:hypothetical protein